MLMDELIGDGVEALLSIGFAGCLDDGIDMGEFIVCEKAIRDEGTSHHYVESEKFAHPSEILVAETERLLADRCEPYHAGPSWTTDAIYRETKEEVRRYAEAGVLTVEMEGSAVFSVADRRGVDAAAMFVVSDYLGLSDWEPKFHLTAEDMQRLGDTAKEILESNVS
jgi:uridine phosphorylase